MKVSALGVLTAFSSLVASSQTPQERAAAAGVLVKQQQCVVAIIATVSHQLTLDGALISAISGDFAVTAVLLDKDGLAATSLAAMEPTAHVAGAMRSLMSSEDPGIGWKSATTNYRIRLANGGELPAEVVGRDENMDLAFFRPVRRASGPLPHVRAEHDAEKLHLFDPVVFLKRFGQAGSWAIGGTITHVVALADDPKRVYTPRVSLGSILFDLKSEFVGITVQLPGSNSSSGPETLGALGAFRNLGPDVESAVLLRSEIVAAAERVGRTRAVQVRSPGAPK